MIEVRVPTYRRPIWLRRALESLQAQTESRWVAVVLDDSTDREGRDVVEALDDRRIHYRPNAGNLGCAGNIDQAFRRKGFLIDYQYACILEDDNWFAVDFLKVNMELMAHHDVALLLGDQFVVYEGQQGPEIGKRTCRDMMAEGLWTRTRLMPQMVFHCGLSNGGLMWRRDCKSQLVVGDRVENSNDQEQLRSLQVAEPFWFSRQPLAYFRFDAKGSSPLSIWERACRLRTQQEIARRVVGLGGPDFWAEALAIAEREGPTHLAQLDFFALMVGHLRHRPHTLSRKAWWIRQTRQAVVRLLAADRLRNYWQQAPIPQAGPGL